MKNFTFANPVKIIFGKDTIKDIAKEIPHSNKVLIIYGGGSIKKNGVYDQVINALEKYEHFEFSGIEPNPHFETCMKAVSIIKENKIDYVLAVGGGSVIDATKFIVAAACFDGDAWDILAKGSTIKKALPFGTVLTLPATGSEMNAGGVITKSETEDKLAFHSPMVFPKFSVLDPTTTYTLPVKQIANGVVDTFVHVIEQYLTFQEDNTLLADYMAEAILKTLIIDGPKALENPTDYDTRANLMWASTWGLNGWIAQGGTEDWSTHMIGHELTAFYGIDHGQTLAIVLPGVMLMMKDQKAKKIERLGKEVFGLNDLSRGALIDKTIQSVEGFFHQMGIKTRLSDYGLGDEAIDKVSKRLTERGWKIGECKNITGEVVREILDLRK